MIEDIFQGLRFGASEPVSCELLQECERGFPLENSAFELFGLDGFEDFLEARAGRKPQADQIATGHQGWRNQRQGGELRDLGLEEFMVVGEPVR